MFLHVSAKFRDFLKNSGILKIATSIPSKLLIFCEIPAKSVRISAKKNRFEEVSTEFYKNLEISQKLCAKFWGKISKF